MKANLLVQLRSGEHFKATTTRAYLADWFRKNQQSVKWLIADINLTRWFYDQMSGWFRGTRFTYVPNKPELWQQKHPDLKPTTCTPFDCV